MTVAALGEADLKRYNVTKLSEAANMIPNFQIYTTGSGNGSVLRLMQNIPNPVTAATQIRFQIPAAAGRGTTPVRLAGGTSQKS